MSGWSGGLAEWPDFLMIRDTRLYDDLGGLGQRIYTTAGQGYQKIKYVRAERLDALEAELAGWKLFADELVSFDPNNEDEIKDAATEIARRFHEMKAELNHSKACAQGLQAKNERLTLDLTAARFNVITQRERAERAEAELATAKNDALALTNAVDELLEVAALRGDDELPHPSNDPILWTARMQEAWDNLKQLRALKREGGT